MNEIVFEAGGYEVPCRLYLWRQTTKIVISDIDGTITKSDKLGHLCDLQCHAMPPLRAFLPSCLPVLLSFII